MKQLQLHISCRWLILHYPSRCHLLVLHQCLSGLCKEISDAGLL